MNRKTIAGGIAAAAIAALSLTACTQSGNAGQAAENQAQQHDTTSLVNDQPIPHFNYSQIRQTLIDAETIAADGTQTTSFFFQMGLPDPVFSCPSLGMPVANTAQLSNPQQVVGTGNSNAVTTGQMDPYGIYAPSASTGTYVICVNSSGAKYLQYWEGDVMTVTSAATWNKTTHTITVSGAPTAVIHTSANK
jgi:hypothetical protein